MTEVPTSASHWLLRFSACVSWPLRDFNWSLMSESWSSAEWPPCTCRMNKTSRIEVYIWVWQVWPCWCIFCGMAGLVMLEPWHLQSFDWGFQLQLLLWLYTGLLSHCWALLQSYIEWGEPGPWWETVGEEKGQSTFYTLLPAFARFHKPLVLSLT